MPRSRTRSRSPRERSKSRDRRSRHGRTYSRSSCDGSQRRSRRSSRRHYSRSQAKKSKHRHRRRDSLSDSDSPASHSDADAKQAVTPTVAKPPQSNYTSIDNPFHDANLEKRFVWKKKREQDRQQGLSSKERARIEQERRREAEEELQTLHQRRKEREREMKQREEDRDRMQREAEAAALGDWDSREEEFHLKQARMRSEIRIKENRAKPIDVLAMNLRLANEEMPDDEEVGIEVDINEPFTICEDLPLAELQELIEEIRFYLSVEKAGNNVMFWECLLTVCQDKLHQQTQRQPQQQQASFSDPLGPLADRVHAMFDGKSQPELVAVRDQIERKLASREPLDVEYWEQLLQVLKVYMAKETLREMHQLLLEKRLTQLRDKQLREALRDQEDLEAELDMATEQPPESSGEPTTDAQSTGADQLSELAPDAQATVSAAAASPKLYAQLTAHDQDVPVLTVTENRAQLLASRRQVVQQRFVAKKDYIPRHLMAGADGDQDLSNMLFKAEASKGMGVDEEMYSLEANLANVTYLWQDKYRPRKPRYFNRVRIGYVWSKFNRAHYDVDNPPPKVVQGYKFNIFYPDLIDKSQAPTYVVEPDPDSEETVFLRFKAGPPYEDLAFRIINKEWEYSRRFGFRSVFDRGVLKLYFWFKRLHYRR
ncbi:hypothetical protein H4R34_003161 [Dimargaris verticillata]|uniref:Splicing factor Cactin n=1 Tax=Dimargaris verticillata TaxID=2761393 RepID=A0A9W8ECW6_9FUNG|nr:hypothetical protein H4R34_003161 [Dimargaris verticillata]